MASEMASSILPSRARLRRSCGFPYQFRPLTSDVRICGRPVHLPPALCSAPFVNQTIHVFVLDAQLLCLAVSVLHELLPPAVARLCLLTDFKQRAQKLVRELVSGLALFLGELADLLQQVRFKRNVLGRHGSLPIIIAPKAESRHGDGPAFLEKRRKCPSLCLGQDAVDPDCTQNCTPSQRHLV